MFRCSELPLVASTICVVWLAGDVGCSLEKSMSYQSALTNLNVFGTEHFKSVSSLVHVCSSFPDVLSKSESSFLVSIECLLDPLLFDSFPSSILVGCYYSHIVAASIIFPYIATLPTLVAN